MSTMSEELTTEDLEHMFGEPPPLCQVLVDREMCGKLASFIWHCECTTAACARKIPDLFACKECHDYVINAKVTWLCAGCKHPVEMRWLPI